MAVRELDGVDDEIRTAVGGLAALTYGTIAILVKRLSIDVPHTLVAPHTSGGTGSGLRLEWRQFNDIVLRDSAGNISGTGSHTTTVWRLIVCRKATGTATPRFSIYDYNTASWTHANGGTTLGDGTAPSSTGTIRFGIGQFGGRGHYRIAAAAYWSNSVKWSTDATGDTAIQNAGLHTAYQNWIDETPTAAWKFNQAATTTPVVDDTGGGADQSAITGTTVITGDDPTGFDFTLSGGAVTGAAALSGDGVLASAAKATAFGASAASGDGTLAASGVGESFGSVALSGDGTLIASYGSVKGAAALGADSSLTATATPRALAASALSVDGTLSATGQATAKAATVLTGDSSLSSAAIAKSFGAVTISADATLLVVLGKITAEAALSASATLAAIAGKKWKLVHPSTTENWPWRGNRVIPLKREKTIFGDDATLYTTDIEGYAPSAQGDDYRAIPADTKYVWYGGRVNTTSDPVIKALWESHGFTVVEV